MYNSSKETISSEDTEGIAPIQSCLNQAGLNPPPSYTAFKKISAASGLLFISLW